ncbi:arad-like aldolase/epimerase [Decorospora gaudefroyi]|uniref:Arad-like aldolase/epimerase n=1 Tax=Decorospora gaudefroyi TaxID=184978 RepID=A0A6A5KEX4_9PLEO|nr:arad-like aldolase/epimerase [Decorospora gaudefroyi]
MVLCNRCAAEKIAGPIVEPHPPQPLPQGQEPTERETKVASQTPTSDQPEESVKREHKNRNKRSAIMSIPPQLQQQLRLLIRANHILHHHGLVDAFGHISVRHPLDKNQYILAAYDPGAPALVKSAADFISYWVEDSSPVDPAAPQGYSERYIHGEVLKRLPEANCVVHSHSEDVIPFTLVDVQVVPVFHMAGFMNPAGVHVFKTRPYNTSKSSVLPKPGESDLLIKNATLGAALASHLREESPVVLQYKHGFTTFGGSIEEAVYRAIYTQKNCVLLQRAISNAAGDAELVDRLDVHEAKECAAMNKKTLDKSFRLWVREVQVNALYENEEGEPEKGKVKGMKM